jgi:phospholipid transport system substrate-binding protein
MERFHFSLRTSALALAIAIGSSQFSAAHAESLSPDSMVKQLFTDVLQTVKSDKSLRTPGNSKLAGVVDTRIMPNIDFGRMMAAVVGPAWRQATPEQQKRLQEEFKALLLGTYGDALAQMEDKVLVVKPFKGAADDKEVLVRTEMRGGTDVIQMDYRLEKAADSPTGWKIYNLNIMGVWLVETYRSQFAQEISSKGLDGLIATLVDHNKSRGKKA